MELGETPSAQLFLHEPHTRRKNASDDRGVNLLRNLSEKIWRMGNFKRQAVRLML